MDSAGSGLVNWPLSGRLCRLGTKQSTPAPKSNKPGGGGSQDCCCKGGLGRPRLMGCQHREMGVGEPILLPTPDLCALGLAHNPHRTLGNFWPLPLALGTLVTRAEAASVSVSSWVCLCKSCVLVCIGLYICVPLWVHAFVFLSLTASFKDMISASFSNRLWGVSHAVLEVVLGYMQRYMKVCGCDKLRKGEGWSQAPN